MRKIIFVALLVILFFAFAACFWWLEQNATYEFEKLPKVPRRGLELRAISQTIYVEKPSPPKYLGETQKASWYDQKNLLNSSNRSLVGDYYGVAHRELPFAMRIRLCSGMRCESFTVADRGPYVCEDKSEYNCEERGLEYDRDWDIDKEGFAYLTDGRLDIGVIEVKANYARN